MKAFREPTSLTWGRPLCLLMLSFGLLSLSSETQAQRRAPSCIHPAEEADDEEEEFEGGPTAISQRDVPVLICNPGCYRLVSNK